MECKEIKTQYVTTGVHCVMDCNIGFVQKTDAVYAKHGMVRSDVYE